MTRHGGPGASGGSAIGQAVAIAGESVLSDPERMSAVMGELMPAMPGYTRLVTAAAEHSLAAALRERLDSGMSLEAAERAAAESLQQATGGLGVLCASIISDLAIVTGLKPEPPPRVFADTMTRVGQDTLIRLRKPPGRAMTAAWDALTRMGWIPEGTAAPEPGRTITTSDRAELAEHSGHVSTVRGKHPGGPDSPGNVIITVEIAGARRRSTTLRCRASVLHMGPKTPKDDQTTARVLAAFTTALRRRR